MILARNNHTPISFFLECPLMELRFWVRANNDIENDRKKKK